MHLTLGPISYRVRFTPQQLHLNRAPVQAICDHKARELIITENIDEEQLKKVIGESVARIWQYRFGSNPVGSQSRLPDSVANGRRGFAESA